MLAEADLRILNSLRAPTSMTDLSDRTEYSPSYVSERVSRLEKFDLVATSQTRPKEVRALNTPVLNAYEELTASHPHVDFPSLISTSLLRVCWFLGAPTAVDEIEPRLTLRRRRIYQILGQLQSRGFIRKQDNRYALTEGLSELAHFAQTVIKYEHQHRTKSKLSTATVIWSGPHEALITTRNATPETVQAAFEGQADWQMTALPRFADYELDFFTAGPPPYFYSEIRSTLTPADFISHTLLLDADTRNLSYCALLLLATDISTDDLRSAATYYGIEDTVNALIMFVESTGDVRHDDVQLPDWAEMTSLAAQYGVIV